MKANKLNILITIFQLALVIIMLAGFNNAGDKSISIGYNARITETDTTLEIYYDGANRMVIHKANHTITFGSSTVNPTEGIEADYFNGSNGLSTIDKLGVHTTVGYTPEFAVEGNSEMTGYLKVDSVWGRTINTPTLTATTGSIITLTGTGATYDNLRASDSLVSEAVKSQTLLMRSKSGPSFLNNESVMYLKGSLLIFAYKDGGGSIYYYYADLSTGANITQLTYSLSEP